MNLSIKNETMSVLITCVFMSHDLIMDVALLYNTVLGFQFSSNDLSCIYIQLLDHDFYDLLFPCIFRFSLCYR